MFFFTRQVKSSVLFYQMLRCVLCHEINRGADRSCLYVRRCVKVNNQSPDFGFPSRVALKMRMAPVSMRTLVTKHWQQPSVLRVNYNFCDGFSAVHVFMISSPLQKCA